MKLSWTQNTPAYTEFGLIKTLEIKTLKHLKYIQWLSFIRINYIQNSALFIYIILNCC